MCRSRFCCPWVPIRTAFTPTPNDISRLAEAKLVFINGAGLEEFLTPMIESAGVDVRLVDLVCHAPVAQSGGR